MIVEREREREREKEREIEKEKERDEDYVVCSSLGPSCACLSVFVG